MNAVHGGEGQLGVLHGACAEQRVDGYGHDAGGVMPCGRETCAPRPYRAGAREGI